MMGMEVAQAMLAQGGQPPIGKILDFACVEGGDGRAVFDGAPRPETCNLTGSVHGGYATSLLDSACGIATVTKLQDGQSSTTFELKVADDGAMTADTGTVRAEGIVISMGRRVAFVEAELADAAGKLLASATSTLPVISP